ncbi:5569_t:CDS:1, partial [Gigaspora rosea]
KSFVLRALLKMTSEFFKKLSQDFTQLLENEYGYDVTFEVGEQS